MRTLNAELAATKNLVFANNAFALTDHCDHPARHHRAGDHLRGHAPRQPEHGINRWIDVTRPSPCPNRLAQRHNLGRDLHRHGALANRRTHPPERALPELRCGFCYGHVQESANWRASSWSSMAATTHGADAHDRARPSANRCVTTACHGS
jgi:hypothetical protein